MKIDLVERLRAAHWQEAADEIERLLSEIAEMMDEIDQLNEDREKFFLENQEMAEEIEQLRSKNQS